MFLGELNKTLNIIVTQGNQSSNHLLFDLKKTVLPVVTDRFLEFESVAASTPPELHLEYANYSRRLLHPMMLSSPFVYHTFTKPLGYAGDYQMVNMLTDDPAQGDTLFSKLMNMHITSTDVAQAHRNRLVILEDEINTVFNDSHGEKPVEILNIGCGPAIEVDRFLAKKSNNRSIKFTLMDFNKETLAYTKNCLKHHRSQILYCEDSVQNLVRRGFTFPTIAKNGYDFIYCAGLFDYLNDKLCRKLLNHFYQHLKPGGKILVTNVTPTQSARYYLEYLLDWHLIYRDRKAFSTFAKPFPRHRVFHDETYANVFLTIEKPVCEGFAKDSIKAIRSEVL